MNLPSSNFCEVFNNSQLFLLEHSNSLLASLEGIEPVSILPASGCPLAAFTVMRSEEGNNSDCLALFFIPESSVVSNLQVQTINGV